MDKDSMVLETSSYVKDDPRISEQEMIDLYEAVRNSKSTASLEEEKRRVQVSDELQQCDLLEDLHLNSELVTEDDSKKKTALDNSDLSTNNSFDSTVMDNDGFDDVDVFNSVPITHPPLQRISYTPKYLPPFYCDPKIKNLPFDDKRKLIKAYHKKLIELYDNFQRQSVHYAPLSEPIQSDYSYNGCSPKTLCKSSISELEHNKTYEHSQEDNFNDIYVLRSGRQTKRKSYTEIRGDEKKYKLTDSPVMQSKKRVIKEFATSNNASRTKTTSEHSKTRSEKLFDNLIESQRKQGEIDKRKDAFVKSLEISNEEEIDFKEEIQSAEVQESFINRRETSPLRGRGQRKKNNKVNQKPKKTAAKETTSKEITNKSLDVTRNDCSTQDDDYGICPVCSLRFPNDQLESHANDCIDSYEIKTSPMEMGRLTCEKCDEVILSSMDYELHVQECLAKTF